MLQARQGKRRLPPRRRLPSLCAKAATRKANSLMSLSLTLSCGANRGAEMTQLDFRGGTYVLPAAVLVSLESW